MRDLSTTLGLNTVAVMVLLSHSVFAADSVSALNFEGYLDSTVLTTQYPGLIFSNTIILAAGDTLNEFEFPPHSGSNVAVDNGGAMTITFPSPIQSFAGYFTYSVPLTVKAYASSGMQLAWASSRYSSNEALSGTDGSSPNEVIQLSSGAGISKVVISGAAAGTSFVLDDAVVSTTSTCNISQDSSPGATDIQLIINETLGGIQPADDLNGDGAVNVVDIQIVINAALGFGCS